MPQHKSESKHEAGANRHEADLRRRRGEEEEEVGADLRRLLDAKLAKRGRPLLNDLEWGYIWYLYETEWVIGDLDKDSNVDRLVREILVSRRSQRAAPPKEEQHHAPIELREEAVAALLAEEMGADPEVQAFRVQTLGGQLLEEDQVIVWLQQQEAAQISPDLWLTDSAVPPDHGERALVRAALDERDDDLPHDARGNLLPLSITVTLDPLQIRQQVARRHLTCTVWNPETEQYHDYRYATADGVLEWLRRLGERLVADCTWKEGEAVYFVLTGIAPFMPRIRDRLLWSPRILRIQLTVDPAVPPSEVADYYRLLRGSLIALKTRKRNMKRLGEAFNLINPRARKHDEKYLRLALFTVEQPRGQGETWRKYMARWNEAWQAQHPDWAYWRYETFERDCARVRRGLLEPR